MIKWTSEKTGNRYMIRRGAAHLLSVYCEDNDVDGRPFWLLVPWKTDARLAGDLKDAREVIATLLDATDAAIHIKGERFTRKIEPAKPEVRATSVGLAGEKTEFDK